MTSIDLTQLADEYVSMNLVIIGSGKGFFSNNHQAIIWTITFINN